MRNDRQRTGQPTYTPQKRLPTGRVQVCPLTPVTRALKQGFRNRLPHARRSVILEVCFSCFQRRAHGSKNPIQGGMSVSTSCQRALEREGQVFTENGSSPHPVELRGGLTGAGVYPLNKRIFATESSTIAVRSYTPQSWYRRRGGAMARSAP